VGLAALVQLALFAAATAPGLAGTSDSGFYLHAAGTLREAGRLLNPDGSAYRYWPPLYPALVALMGSPSGVRVLHGACLVASLVAWSRLGRWLLPGPGAAVLPWAVALSTPWLVVSKFVWGEVAFLALFAGYAGALFQWWRTRQGGWFALAAGLGFLLPLQRTAGFFLLAGVGAGLLLETRKQPKQWAPLTGHFALTVLGGLAWHYYALLLAAPSVYKLNRGWPQFFSSAADYGFVLSRWLLPVKAAWRPELSLLWALALVGILMLLWPQRPRGPVAESPSGNELPSATRFLRVLWTSTVVFVLLLIISTTFTRSAAGLHDAERYASVLFAPVVVLAVHRVAGQAGRPGLPQLARLVVMGVVGFWLLYSAGRAVSNVAALRKLPPLTLQAR
jgi:hypothetical protein